jgi:DNA gyrase subunit A
MMATRKGLVKKTPLEDYSRPKRGGIIAIKLREDDEVVDVVITKPGDEVILATSGGMAIRFSEADARPMGRNTSGVKGISLMAGDHLVGMVVADPEATLLTVCERGYGKRTTFGPNASTVEGTSPPDDLGEEDAVSVATVVEEASAEADDSDGAEEGSSGMRYRTQRRGGKGLRDIKTTTRNGRVVGIVRVDDSDELLMMTARGKIQRMAAADMNVIGRNTQGVRIMSLDAEDSLVAVVRVPQDDADEAEVSQRVAEVMPPPTTELGPSTETPSE